MSRLVYWLLVAIVAIVSGDVSSGKGEQPRYRPNALLIGHSIRDLRLPASARFAEQLDADRWLLYLAGTRVRVDVRPEGMNLVNRRGSAIDTLVWVDQRRHLVASGRWAGDGPTFGLFFDSS